jgi:hypothetical protein
LELENFLVFPETIWFPACFSAITHQFPWSHTTNSAISQAHIVHDSAKQPHGLQQHARQIIFENFVSCVAQNQKEALCAITHIAHSEFSSGLTFYTHCFKCSHEIIIIKTLAKKCSKISRCRQSISCAVCSSRARSIALSWCLR